MAKAPPANATGRWVKVHGKRHPEIVCRMCGKTKGHKSHGLCSHCYNQAYSHTPKAKEQKKLRQRAYDQRPEVRRKAKDRLVAMSAERALAGGIPQYKRKKHLGVNWAGGGVMYIVESVGLTQDGRSLLGYVPTRKGFGARSTSIQSY